MIYSTTPLTPEQFIDLLGRSTLGERRPIDDPDTIAGMVANWPTGATAGRAARLGLHPDKRFSDIIRQYIDDCRTMPGGEAALKGLS